ncbi:hypothetical protein [Neptuniibacter sp. QD37_11]|uniref:hypothetical protein n=1 Tax=Neptuniibacter sp. QD37_11 TaxID=3398209 RepID=UPI0039F52F2A
MFKHNLLSFLKYVYAKLTTLDAWSRSPFYEEHHTRKCRQNQLSVWEAKQQGLYFNDKPLTPKMFESFQDSVTRNMGYVNATSGELLAAIHNYRMAGTFVAEVHPHGTQTSEGTTTDLRVGPAYASDNEVFQKFLKSGEVKIDDVHNYQAFKGIQN